MATGTGTVPADRRVWPVDPARTPAAAAQRITTRMSNTTGGRQASVPTTWETPVRTIAPFLACIALVVAITAGVPGRAVAQETVITEGEGMGGLAGDPGACGCRAPQAPPWHGSVAGAACGPSCPPPTMFHADPCGQLWLKHSARQHGCVLPPCFPRMHGWLSEGLMPTPRPIVTPRCPRCGAHIEQGF